MIIVLSSCANAVSLKSLTCKACAIDILHTMIWYQKPFFPSHEYCTTILVIDCHVRPFSLMPYMLKSRKTRPMHHVLVLSSSPILGQEPIPTANDLSIK